MMIDPLLVALRTSTAQQHQALERDLAALVGAGEKHILQKPLSEHDLATKIAELLARAHTESETLE